MKIQVLAWDMLRGKLGKNNKSQSSHVQIMILSVSKFCQVCCSTQNRTTKHGINTRPSHMIYIVCMTNVHVLYVSVVGNLILLLPFVKIPSIETLVKIQYMVTKIRIYGYTA